MFFDILKNTNTKESLPRRIGIILPGCISYGGGGENFVLSLSAYLSKKLFRVSIFEDEDSCIRTGSQIDIYQTYFHGIDIDLKRVKYKHYSLIRLAIISQRLPYTSYLLSYQQILIMCYRLPSKKFSREINIKNIDSVFLLHGITFEKFSLLNLKASLYSTMNKFILKTKVAIYNKYNFKFQVLNPECYFILKKSGINEKNLFLTDLALNGREFKPIRNDDVFIVVYISRLEERQKGVNRFIKVIRQLDRLGLPDLKILIAGKGSAVHKITKLISITNCAKYLGYIGEHTKAEILSKGGVFISTSNIEPYGLSIIEALHSGLPSVVTPVSGLSYIVSRCEDYGIVSSFKTNLFVSDIMKFYTDWKSNKETYFNKRVNISLKSKQNFSENAMFESISDMLRESF